MDFFDKFDETPYETEPVEGIVDAMQAFVGAFDTLRNALVVDYDTFAEDLRLAMYKPVWRSADTENPPISLYEIGVAHSPNRSVAGRYFINDVKLAEALAKRAEDIRALLIQDEVGILPSLCNMLAEFLSTEREEELPKDVFAAGMRFLNECRRLAVMWEV